MASENQTATVRVNVPELQKYNEFLQKQVARLIRENFQLKKSAKVFVGFGMQVPDNITLSVPEDRPQSWAEKSEHFEPLLRAICEAVYELTKLDAIAVHYDLIEKWIARHHAPLYKNMKQPSGTIAARCRDLRRDGYLATPNGEQAVFLPGEKYLKEKQ